MVSKSNLLSVFFLAWEADKLFNSLKKIRSDKVFLLFVVRGFEWVFEGLSGIKKKIKIINKNS